MPQFDRVRNKGVNYKNLYLGLFLFSVGLFKKVIIADYFAPFATAGFDHAKVLPFFQAWFTSLAYTLQIYYDFSGYTDMALGSSWMFNIRLPINFDSPYKSLNIQDFWRRWHITLSRFLRDYIYIPLGGNRFGELKTYHNLMATFLLGGLWHGAGWTFVFWGFLHGFAMIIHRFWRKFNLEMPSVLAWLITFNFLNITWIFFRAKSWDDAIKVLKGMFGLSGITLPYFFAAKFPFLRRFGFDFGQIFRGIGGSSTSFLMIVIFLVIALFCKNSNQLAATLKPNWTTSICIAVISCYAILNMNKLSEFIYFQF
jgi:alginate O-acetyltransferase complex protein AlgI